MDNAYTISKFPWTLSCNRLYNCIPYKITVYQAITKHRLCRPPECQSPKYMNCRH